MRIFGKIHYYLWKKTMASNYKHGKIMPLIFKLRISTVYDDAFKCGGMKKVYIEHDKWVKKTLRKLNAKSTKETQSKP